jgi:hypothetical protein
MMGHSAAVLFALATMAASLDRDVSSLQFDLLEAGQRFEIQTAAAWYRGELTNRSTGECQLSVSADGSHFAAPHTVFLLGATAGRQRQMLVRMHEVSVGLKLELGQGDLKQEHRSITDEVTSIRLIGSPAANVARGK